MTEFYTRGSLLLHQLSILVRIPTSVAIELPQDIMWQMLKIEWSSYSPYLSSLIAVSKRLSVTNLCSENSLPIFWLNASDIRAKVKKHLCTTDDTCHWRSKVGEHCSILPASSSQRSNNQRLLVLHFTTSYCTWSDQNCCPKDMWVKGVSKALHILSL